MLYRYSWFLEDEPDWFWCTMRLTTLILNEIFLQFLDGFPWNECRYSWSPEDESYWLCWSLSFFCGSTTRFNLLFSKVCCDHSITSVDEVADFCPIPIPKHQFLTSWEWHSKLYFSHKWHLQEKCLIILLTYFISAWLIYWSSSPFIVLLSVHDIPNRSLIKP